MHTSYYRLRVEKLAVAIYAYLHEYSDYYKEQKHHAELENLDNAWMDGTFFPTEQQIDPMSATNRTRDDLVFFPLEDIKADLFSWLDDKEKNKMKTLGRQGEGFYILIIIYILIS
jgi:hypothetical protein